MLRTPELSYLLDLLREPTVTAEQLQRGAQSARQSVRLTNPPHALPSLESSFGIMTMSTHHHLPHHGQSLTACDRQPIRFGSLHVQREFVAFRTTNGLDIDIRFPTLAKSGHFNDSPEIRAWIKTHRRKVKKTMTEYVANHAPLLGHHWEYALMLSLLTQIDRLATIERDSEELRRLLGLLDGTPQQHDRYRDAAGTLSRPPQ